MNTMDLYTTHMKNANENACKQIQVIASSSLVRELQDKTDHKTTFYYKKNSQNKTLLCINKNKFLLLYILRTEKKYLKLKKKFINH